MKMLHNSRFNLIHDDKEFEPEDKEEINLFIFCLYLIAFGLVGSLILFIYQNF